jgi:hypothetical protein
MADVFLTCSDEDLRKAERLAVALEQFGWTVSSDRRVLAAGGNWLIAHAAELESAKCVVALWSPAADSSSWVRQDATVAQSKGVLVSVLIEEVGIPRGFQNMVHLDLRTWPGTDAAPEFQRLRESIQRLVEPTSGKRSRSTASAGIEALVTPPVIDPPTSVSQMTTVAPLAPEQAGFASSAESGQSSLPGQAATKTLFLCYRREDTQDAAGRLHDRLADAFGFERVFMDIDIVPLGIDFVDHVAEQISRCSVVIVMMGKQWLSIKDKKRRRRLDNSDDLVRVEIATALKQRIPVIPVVVQNASMPVADDLPEDIRPLARRNGIQLRPEQWKDGVERLLKELDKVMGHRKQS